MRSSLMFHLEGRQPLIFSCLFLIFRFVRSFFFHSKPSQIEVSETLLPPKFTKTFHKSQKMAVNEGLLAKLRTQKTGSIYTTQPVHVLSTLPSCF